MFDFVIGYGKNVFTLSVNAANMDQAIDKVKKICPDATYRPYNPTVKFGDVAHIA